MQLILNTFGASLRKKDDMFLVRSGERQALVSPRKVQSIVLAAGVHLSTDAIRLALMHHIDIALLDKYGEPYGRFWHARLGSTNRLRRRLLEIAETEDGVILVGEWVTTKIGQQAGLLRDLARTRPDRAADLETTAGRLDKMADVVAGLKGDAIDELRGSMMGLEGVAGREYFAALSLALPERFRFQGRSRSPARDEFNALLNYAYGVLYSLVERACLLTGLDPCIGLMHTDNYNKPSLVYDLIELHRVHAERVVVNLFAARKVKQDIFDQADGGFRLNAEGRGLLLNDLNEYLDRMKHHGRRRLKIRDTIVYECQRLAGRLLRGLNDDREVDLSVFDLAAELGGVPSGPTGESAAGVASPEDPSSGDAAGAADEGDDRADGQRVETARPPGPGVNGRGALPRPNGPVPNGGDPDVDLGTV
jgi:CRISP-associated protein Cas1